MKAFNHGAHYTTEIKLGLVLFKRKARKFLDTIS